MTDGENEGDDCDEVICAEVNQEESEHNYTMRLTE